MKKPRNIVRDTILVACLGLLVYLAFGADWKPKPAAQAVAGQGPAAQVAPAAVGGLAKLDGEEAILRVKLFMRRQLADADSYEPIEFGRELPSEYNGMRCWAVTHRYVYRNEMGGMAYADAIIWLDDKQVLGWQPL